jgi:hypothetical protein
MRLYCSDFCGDDSWSSRNIAVVIWSVFLLPINRPPNRLAWVILHDSVGGCMHGGRLDSTQRGGLHYRTALRLIYIYRTIDSCTYAIRQMTNFVLSQDHQVVDVVCGEQCIDCSGC